MTLSHSDRMNNVAAMTNWMIPDVCLTWNARHNDNFELQFAKQAREQEIKSISSLIPIAWLHELWSQRRGRNGERVKYLQPHVIHIICMPLIWYSRKNCSNQTPPLLIGGSARSIVSFSLSIFNAKQGRSRNIEAFTKIIWYSPELGPVPLHNRL